jgi:drug/metabolite transporter (DMT)-like permease
LVGAIGTAIPFTLLSWATLSVSAGYTSILNATAPIFTALIAWTWVGEKLSLAGIAGLLIGFSGVVVMVFDRQGGEQIALLPVFAALGATLCYGIQANYTRQKLRHIPPLVNALGSQSGAAMTMLPFTIWLWPSETPGQDAWIGVALLGVACTGIAFILYFRLIAAVGPNKAISVTYLIPFFGVLWGMLFLDESLSGYMIMGTLLILLGVSLTTGVFRRRSASG